jgi:hypothetical protein
LLKRLFGRGHAGAERDKHGSGNGHNATIDFHGNSPFDQLRRATRRRRHEPTASR